MTRSKLWKRVFFDYIEINTSSLQVDDTHLLEVQAAKVIIKQHLFENIISCDVISKLTESNQSAKLLHHVSSKDTHDFIYLICSLVMIVSYKCKIIIIKRVFSIVSSIFTFLDHISDLKFNFSTTSFHIRSISALVIERLWSYHEWHSSRFVIMMTINMFFTIVFIDSWTSLKVYLSLRLLLAQNTLYSARLEAMFFLFDFELFSNTRILSRSWVKCRSNVMSLSWVKLWSFFRWRRWNQRRLELVMRNEASLLFWRRWEKEELELASEDDAFLFFDL